MSSPSNSSGKVRFGDYELDLATSELRTNGNKLLLQGQPFEILCMLLERPGQLVTREELKKRLWSEGIFVDYDHSLNKAVNRLREVLADSADYPRFIETIPRRGYRFAAPVERVQGNGALITDAEPTKAQNVPNSILSRIQEIAPRLDPTSQPGKTGYGFRPPITLMDSGQGSTAPEVAQNGIDSRTQDLPHRYLRILAVAAFSVVFALSVVFWSQKHKSDSIPELRLKQLTLNSNQKPVFSGVISPDGKYLAYTDPDGIHLQLIETDESRTIARTSATKDSQLWKVVGWLAGSTFFVANLYVPDQNQQSIWLYSVLGESPRKLRDDAEAWSTSRDGSLIAFGNKFLRSGPLELWIMDARGEHEEKLVGANANTALQGAQFSPDGRWIAYVRHLAIQGTTEETLETRSLTRGTTNKIVSTRQICGHVWLPDGRLIYGLPENSDPGNSNYWTLLMDPHSGRADSSPQRLTNWAGFDLRQVSATSDGKRLAFLASVGVVEEYLADYSSAKQISGPKRLALDGMNGPFGWTPDGKQIILSTVRNGHLAIFKQSLESGSIEPIVASIGQHAAAPRLSPDGAWILYFAIPDNLGSGPASLMRVPISGGPSHYVLQSRSSDYRCSLAPASLCLFSERTADGKQLIWKSFDPLLGALNEFARMDADADAGYDWALSPDARTIVIRKNREASVDFLDLTTHKFRHVAVEGWNLATNMDWAPDGRGFFTCGIRSEGATLLYVDLKGRAQPIWEYDGDFLWGVLSPDGKHLAMGAQTEKNNLWMMENF